MLPALTPASSAFLLQQPDESDDEDDDEDDDDEDDGPGLSFLIAVRPSFPAPPSRAPPHRLADLPFLPLPLSLPLRARRAATATRTRKTTRTTATLTRPPPQRSRSPTTRSTPTTSRPTRALSRRRPSTTRAASSRGRGDGSRRRRVRRPRRTERAGWTLSRSSRSGSGSGSGRGRGREKDGRIPCATHAVQQMSKTHGFSLCPARARAQPKMKKRSKRVHTPRTVPMMTESRRRRELIMPMTELSPGTCAARACREGRQLRAREKEREREGKGTHRRRRSCAPGCPTGPNAARQTLRGSRTLACEQEVPASACARREESERETGRTRASGRPCGGCCRSCRARRGASR